MARQQGYGWIPGARTKPQQRGLFTVANGLTSGQLQAAAVSMLRAVKYSREQAFEGSGAAGDAGRWQATCAAGVDGRASCRCGGTADPSGTWRGCKGVFR
jgi:hypothetical protein